MSELVIKNLHVNVEDTEILKGVDLTIKSGEIHAVMGPNGTGKSTLAYSLMGHPKYQVTEGEVTLDGVDLFALEPNERSALGLFLPSSTRSLFLAFPLRTSCAQPSTLTAKPRIRGTKVSPSLSLERSSRRNWHC